MARGEGLARLSGGWFQAIALSIGFALLLAGTVRAADSSGTEFWLAFEPNGAAGAVLSVQILGASGTTGSVDIAGLGSSTPFTIPADGLATVGLPAGAMLSTSDGVEDLGVHVTASKAVVVYGLDIHSESADSYLALPVPALGLAYYTVSYTPDVSFSSQFAVVATADGTHVTVTPAAAIGAHMAGVDFAVALDAGQVYQAQSSGDLTGTKLVADLPIAVLSGNPWADVPVGVGFADHLAEQLLPIASWGMDAFVIPSALRTAAERLRLQVSAPSQVVTMSPGGDVALQPGAFAENTFSTPVRLQSQQPFSVAQFATGGSDDNDTGDPFLLMPLAVERFARCYLVATADDGTIFPDNFANIVVPASGVGEVELDDAPISAGSFTAIGTTGFSYVQLAVDPGRHRLTAPLAFGASVYGFGTDVSYASPAGGSSPPFADGLQECPEPSSLGLAIAAAAAMAALAARSQETRALGYFMNRTMKASRIRSGRKRTRRAWIFASVPTR
jgi:hypothetical protein